VATLTVGQRVPPQVVRLSIYGMVDGRVNDDDDDDDDDG